MLKIFGHLVEVNYEILRGKNHNGLNNSDYNKMEISADLPTSKQEEVLLHEVFHNISDNLNLNLEEDTVQRLAVGLHTIIIDNPEVFSLDLPVDKEEMN